MRLREHKELSEFGFDTPAAQEGIAIWAKKLSIAFPGKPAEFWGLVSQKAQQERLSQRRLDYIYRELTSRGNLFNIGDIFNIDRRLKKWSDKLPINPTPNETFAAILVNNTYYFMTLAEAQELCVPYKEVKCDSYGRIIL